MCLNLHMVMVQNTTSSFSMLIDCLPSQLSTYSQSMSKFRNNFNTLRAVALVYKTSRVEWSSTHTHRAASFEYVNSSLYVNRFRPGLFWSCPLNSFKLYKTAKFWKRSTSMVTVRCDKVGCQSAKKETI